VPEFISQRRRWLNGAFFAAVYSLLHFRQVWYTDHTVWRKILLHIEFVYQFVNLLFTFFSLVSFPTATAPSQLLTHDVGKLLPHILLYCRLHG
jgi:chitin synthase